ncbi:hypothetical protein [Burkholderia gladioli]|uniref:hypothetical protein n=1 Tax=Burkholderia gladioli TaxID=28095 RepID=UPI00163FED42|nr:hypothetical protein [Burkholderia gladioli]
MAGESEKKVTIRFSDDRSEIQKLFDKGIAAVPNVVSNQVAQKILTGVSPGFFAGNSGLVIAGAFQAVSAEPHTANVLGAVGQFAILTVHLGPVGMVLGLPDLVFSVFGWLDAEDMEAARKRWAEIEESMLEKYDQIVKEAAEKRRALADQAIDIDTKKEEREAFYIDGASVTFGEIYTLRSMLNDSRFGGEQNYFILAQVARPMKRQLNEISNAGIRVPQYDVLEKTDEQISRESDAERKEREYGELYYSTLSNAQFNVDELISRQTLADSVEPVAAKPSYSDWRGGKELDAARADRADTDSEKSNGQDTRLDTSDIAEHVGGDGVNVSHLGGFEGFRGAKK